MAMRAVFSSSSDSKLRLVDVLLFLRFKASGSKLRLVDVAMETLQISIYYTN